jgi:leader peptidase (prepilin peptidase) / N-methyltransferase
MDVAIAAVLAGVFGLVFGSFLNVVAYRLPRKESLSKPRSRCPSCGAQIKAYDNIPVLSWLLLRGRCRNCGERISARYPLVEGATALLCAICVVVLGADEDAVIGIVFVLLLVPITLIDLDHRIIPNTLTLLGAVLAVALVAALKTDDLVEHLISAAAAGGFLLIAAIVKPGGMGMGDVKLAGMMGLFLGRAVGPAMFAALIAGSLLGAMIMARRGTKEGRKATIPFGPWLAFGGLIGLFLGDTIVDAYLTTFE